MGMQKNKQAPYPMLLASALCLALGACSSTDMGYRNSSASAVDAGDAPATATASDRMTSGSGQGGYSTPSSSATTTAPPAAGASSGNAAGSAAATSATTSSTHDATGTADSAISRPHQQAADAVAGATTYGMVQAIEPITRAQAGGMVAAGDSGLATSGTSTSGTSGAGSTSAGSDMVYRITVRLQDGTMKAMVQETLPTYHIGDRVRMANGIIQRY